MREKAVEKAVYLSRLPAQSRKSRENYHGLSKGSLEWARMQWPDCPLKAHVPSFKNPWNSDGRGGWKEDKRGTTPSVNIDGHSCRNGQPYPSHSHARHWWWNSQPSPSHAHDHHFCRNGQPCPSHTDHHCFRLAGWHCLRERLGLENVLDFLLRLLSLCRVRKVQYPSDWLRSINIHSNFWRFCEIVIVFPLHPIHLVSNSGCQRSRVGATVCLHWCDKSGPKPRGREGCGVKLRGTGWWKKIFRQCPVDFKPRVKLKYGCFF